MTGAGTEPGTGRANRHPLALVRTVTRQLTATVVGIGLERWARLLAVALVPLLLREPDVATAVLQAVLTAYVLLTALAERTRFWRDADVLAALVLVVGTGGQVLPFLLFLLVAVAGPASTGDVAVGAGIGGLLTVVLLVVLALGGDLAQLDALGAAAVSALLPLTGATVAAASRVLTEPVGESRTALREANRHLEALLAVADDLPGGLDATTVSAAVVAEVRDLPGAVAVAVFVEEDGALRLTATAGPHPSGAVALRVDVARRVDDLKLRTRRELPEGTEATLEDAPFWVGCQLGAGDEPLGLLLVGLRRAEDALALRPTLARVATDATIALQNARLFDGTLARAAETARRRLAADLHDGVAQSLAHLKMELELQTVTGGRRTADLELRRLATVADRALTDLRATIDGLRQHGGDDLATRLRAHLDAVAPHDGPRIVLESAGAAPVSADRADDLLRIAQEALSNALRHAHATAITVSLERDEGIVELVIEDDGVGRERASDHPGGGVGLRSIRERVERLGGELTVRDRLGGGTIVAVRCAPRGARSQEPPSRTGPREPARPTADVETRPMELP